MTPTPKPRPNSKSDAPLRKVAVIGTTGAGETTFSVQLAERLGVVHVELDSLYHGPNWMPAPDEDFRRAVQGALVAEGWVADGNYSGSLGDLVLEQADLVVWLDIPFGSAGAVATKRRSGGSTRSGSAPPKRPTRGSTGRPVARARAGDRTPSGRVAARSDGGRAARCR